MGGPVVTIFFGTMARLQRLSLTVSNEQLQAVTAEAKRLGITTSEVVRRVLDRERGVKPWDGIVMLISRGRHEAEGRRYVDLHTY
jgi:hypothetical protein